MLCQGSDELFVLSVKEFMQFAVTCMAFGLYMFENVTVYFLIGIEKTEFI